MTEVRFIFEVSRMPPKKNTKPRGPTGRGPSPSPINNARRENDALYQPEQNVVYVTVQRGAQKSAQVSPYTEDGDNGENYIASTKPFRDTSSDGMAKGRKCQDVFWLFFFLLFWIANLIICYAAIKNGDPKRLLLPLDYLGNYCGINNTLSGNSTKDLYANLTDKPYIYYFDPTLLEKSTFICVAMCPNITQITATPETSICRYDTVATTSTLPGLAISGLCTSHTYLTSPILNKCLPIGTIPTSISNSTTVTITDAASFLSVSKNAIVNR